MAEQFKLDVDFNGEVIEVDCELRMFGNSHKIAVQYRETAIIFERDEDQNYRALIAEGEILDKQITTAFLKAVAEALEEAFR